MDTTTLRPIDRVLEALHYEGPRAKRSTFACHCPCHDDSQESLSVTETKLGKILLHCHAGCKSKKIVEAIGLEWADLFPPPQETSKDFDSIVATYDYVDEAGAPLYQVVRFEPKKFRQRQPDGKGGWIWSITNPAVRRVPYHLPALNGSDKEDWVFITEGEKDSDNLIAHDLIATTNAMGAGKWEATYNPYFADRRVCILPDNDQAGRDHAHDIAKNLLGVAAWVCMVELSGLPPKGDVSDWLEQGHTAQELIELADAAPPYIAPIPGTGKSHVNGAEEDEPEEGSQEEPEQAKKRVGPTTAIQAALTKLGYAFRFNLIKERIEYEDGTALHDGEEATIIARLFEMGFKNKGLIRDIIYAQAWANRYDPLRDFLKSLTWDGDDHIRLLSYYFTDAHPLIEYADGRKETVFHAWLRRWLVGAVAKVLDSIQNPLLVLVSEEQGVGKSEFAKWVCSPLPSYFVESFLNPESTEHQRLATESFIWEIGELGATTRKSDIESLKAFVSRHEHSYRAPYARHGVTKPARASFIGTINKDNSGFLGDATGSRRFLTVEVTAIHWKGYVADIDVRQVWAQAYALYCQNPNAWQLDETELATRILINQDFEVEDPVQEAILYFYEVEARADPTEGAPFLSTADIILQVAIRVKTTTTKALQMDVARAMRKLGVTKGKMTGCTTRGYYGVQLKSKPQ